LPWYFYVPELRNIHITIGGTMSKSKVSLAVSCICLSVFVLPLVFRREQPYIDPGAGSLIIQVLIAGILGAFFTAKVFWTKVNTFFHRHLFKNAEPDAGKEHE
jgi:hypothetical protein